MLIAPAVGRAIAPGLRLALEGGVCSGKSTAVRHLIHRYGLTGVPEHMEMLPADHPAAREILTPEVRLQVFLGLEAARTRLILGASGPAVADRTILSVIAFEHALRKIAGGPGLTVPEEAGSMIVALPPRLVVIRVSDEQRRERWTARGFSCSSIFVSPEFNSAISDVYWRAGEVTETYHIDARRMSLDELLDEASDAYHSVAADAAHRVMPLSTLLALLAGGER